MATYRERREARTERLREWADKRDEKAQASFQRATDLMKDVPFGQPILIGHHSEAATRRRGERVTNSMNAGVDSSRKAEEMRQRADNIETAAGRAIYSDDADAIEKLRERIAHADSLRAEIKAFNVSVRKGTPDESILSPQMLKNLHELRTMRGMMGDKGQLPPYLSSNLGGNISRMKKRLVVLERRAA